MTDYGRIGVGYAAHRVADPRIEAYVHAALDNAATVVNVGAGTGNYEPTDRRVVAVEPSLTMLAQRAPSAAPAVRAYAEALPFASGSFDLAMGVLTVHHWSDPVAGLREMTRVAERVVVLFFEMGLWDAVWILQYWPELAALPSEQNPPTEAFFRHHLDVESVVAIPVPWDCTDGFAGAYWRRPEAYFDRALTAGMSSFAQLDDVAYERGAARLRADLDSGQWERKYGHLLGLDEVDLGYRIVTGFPRSPSQPSDRRAHDRRSARTERGEASRPVSEASKRQE